MIPFSKKTSEEKRDIAARAMLKVILVFEALHPEQINKQNIWDIFLDNTITDAEKLRDVKYQHNNQGDQNDSEHKSMAHSTSICMDK